jgi:paraquat-inducible protein A
VKQFLSCESCGLVSEASIEGVHCPRCATPLQSLKPLALQQSTAYLIAAALLYVPSNLLPVMSTRSVVQGGDREHTLIGGIGELWEIGSWELAAIVFTASIVVPMLKMVVLTLLIVTSHRRSQWRQRERAALFRMIETVGHWSMLDVYVVVMLAGMMQFGALGTVEAEPGLLAFGSVVVFTMLAAGSFDPRLIWPEAQHGRA